MWILLDYWISQLLTGIGAFEQNYLLLGRISMGNAIYGIPVNDKQIIINCTAFNSMKAKLLRKPVSMPSQFLYTTAKTRVAQSQRKF